MMKFEIDANFKGLKNLLKGLPDKAIDQVLVASINRATRDGKRAATKKMVAATGVRRSAIAGAKRKGKRTISPRVTGGTGNARANKKRKNTMVFFKTDQDVSFSNAFGKGAIKKVSDTDGKSFVATMESGKRSRWYRTGQPKRHPQKGRYKGTGILREPIKEVGIPIKHATEAGKRALEAKVRESLPKEMKRLAEIKFKKLSRRL